MTGEAAHPNTLIRWSYNWDNIHIDLNS